MKDQQLPSYMQSAPKTATDQTAAPSLNFLSFNLNGKFIFKQGSDSKNLGDAIEIVILAIDPPKPFVNSRAYWPGKFDPSTTGQPECASPDGVKPYGWIADPQAGSCSNCQWSVLGSSGFGKSTQCKSFKMIYFVFADNVKGGIGAFRAPITSLKNLSTYRWDIQQLGAPIAGVVTKVSFDEESEYTKPVFNFERFLSESDFMFTTQLAASAEMKQFQTSNETAAQIEAPTEAEVTEEVEAVSSFTAEYTNETAEEVLDIDSFLDAPAEEVSILDSLTKAIQDTSCQKELAEALTANKESYKKLSADEQQKYKAFAMAHVATFTTVKEPTLAERINEISSASDLPAMLEYLRQENFSATSHEGKLFIVKAGRLNGESWNSAIHGTSRDGYPALTKAGQFTKRKNLDKKATTTQQQTTDDGQIEEAMRLLETL